MPLSRGRSASVARDQTSFNDPSCEAGKEVPGVTTTPARAAARAVQPREPKAASPGQPDQPGQPGHPPQPGHTVLDGPDLGRALTRIAHEILERNRGGEG